ncbi:glycoside hydrolase family 31 protein [Streptomyces sp. TRM 70361]|uniref:glycoside hydrolase family 31 protein n=1 Tax=Streptomyces sp. TRM 70361 TaxID=3116553 RepID=UPI002E7ABCDB|nr:glycoside hydrolase family 31 protein [Streptomyces sp. TRM 70361]MEE1943166.1 glycoside hydrolase family 31 protein [Streptomyces sp. TRM 70361]
MDARGLVRSVRVVGAVRGLRAVRSAWRGWRTDVRGLPRGGRERARMPGEVVGAEPRPGGGVVRFERSSLRVRVTAGGVVFCGWDGAAPEPSYALVGSYPQADARAVLEPDKDGGWRVVSERVLVTVTRLGAVEVRTPGGVVLRRDLPPRWWEPVDGGADGGSGGARGRWAQRSEVPADARFYGLGGRSPGPRLRDGSYRLWNASPGAPPGSSGPGHDARSLTAPVLWVVADAGSHLVFHDNSWDGLVTLLEGLEGAGSGHDRPGRCETRMSGGPLRYWVLTGAPSRVMQGWRTLTGSPVVPPRWALGHQHALWGAEGEAGVRRVVAGYTGRGLPLRAVQLGAGHQRRCRGFTVDSGRFPDLPALASALREDGVRLVSVVEPAVRARAGEPVYDAGLAGDVFVRDARGVPVRGAGRTGGVVFPDFTAPRTRAWWGGLYAERLERGFAGFCHEMDGPVSLTAFGDPTLPRSARHDLDSRGGDHREAHNVYALQMARAAFEGLRGLRPRERPFLLAGSGWAGSQRYGGTFTDQGAAGWAGLRAALAQVIGLGLCGVPYCGTDAGGTAGPPPSPELYLRWFQLAAYLPLFRTRSTPEGGRREPWEFGPEVLEHARAALRERERLLPYFVTLARLAHRSGAPYVRPLWWGAPKDRTLRECEDAFLLGDALLVAPVLEAGVTRRAVRLPRGRWYDTVTEEAYEGPGQVVVEAPPARIPVLARAGAVLPVTGPGGGIELEVWAPPHGRTGGGVVIADPGDGWGRAEPERFSVRLLGREAVVAREGDSETGYPVRVRGTAG